MTFCHALKLKSPKDGKSYKLEENRQAARDGGKIAGNARKEIEEHTGKAVITSQNAIDFGKLISDVTKELPENRIDRSKKK